MINLLSMKKINHVTLVSAEGNFLVNVHFANVFWCLRLLGSLTVPALVYSKEEGYVCLPESCSACSRTLMVATRYKMPQSCCCCPGAESMQFV